MCNCQSITYVLLIVVNGLPVVWTLNGCFILLAKAVLLGNSEISPDGCLCRLFKCFISLDSEYLHTF
jgi:hypothetical protein